MKIIAQYAEMANLQKSAKKDENQVRKEEAANNSARTPVRKDTAELSEGARKMSEVYQMKSKLREIPDPREERVQNVIERLRSGALVNPAAVRSSIARMIEQGVFM